MKTKEDYEAVNQYWSATAIHAYEPTPTEADKERAKSALKASLSEDVTAPGVFHDWLKEACDSKDDDNLEYTMTLGFVFRLFDESCGKLLIPIATADWIKTSSGVEDLTELIEVYGGEDSVETLARMALYTYPEIEYLGDDRQYVARKAMWSLHRIYEDKGSEEALEQMKKLAVCGNIMVENLAMHHLRDYFHLEGYDE